MISRDQKGAPGRLAQQNEVEVRRRLHAVRLSAVNRVVRALAHESRNALQRAQACLSLLRLKLRDDQELVALVDETEAAHDRLVALYDHVRRYAKEQPLELRPIALDELAKRVWQNVARSGTHRLELRVEAEDPRCRADEEALGSALEALFCNAMEAASPGSSVAVEIVDASIGRSPAVSLIVGDEGPGVAAEARERLFELFFTTKAGHLGLGLAEARKTVEAHGGRLTALDEERGGARFQLVVPRAHA